MLCDHTNGLSSHRSRYTGSCLKLRRLERTQLQRRDLFSSNN